MDNPERYGVAYIGNNKIINLKEKPKIVFSNWAITGLYALTILYLRPVKR